MKRANGKKLSRSRRRAFTKRPLALAVSRTIGLATCIGLGSVAVGTSAIARDVFFRVDSTADTGDVNPNDGICADASGNCTIRAALEEAYYGGNIAISIPTGTYRITEGELEIPLYGYVTIQGEGERDETIIQGGGFRSGQGDLTIKNLTITGASAGARVLEGDLVASNCIISDSLGPGLEGSGEVENCVITGNGGPGFEVRENYNATINESVISGNGSAGVLKRGYGNITVRNSIISENQGPGVTVDDEFDDRNDVVVSDSVVQGNQGGGIDLGKIYESNVRIESTTITGNSKSGDGGGIELVSSYDSTLEIKNSTIDGNVAQGQGGGIFVSGEALVSFENATISNNDSRHGGGVHFADDFCASSCAGADLENVTIVGNDASVSGGGIHSLSKVRIENSVIAGNSNGNCSLQIESKGYNLDSDGTCSLSAPGDLFGDPRLGPFSATGEPGGGYFPPLKDSPLIDAGNSKSCSDFDQIRKPRFDGDGDGRVVCDIGAIEFQGDSPDLPQKLNIEAVNVPVRESRAGNIIDSNLGTTWFNDGRSNTAWYELDLGKSRRVTKVEVAPRPDKTYTVSISVHPNAGQPGSVLARKDIRADGQSELIPVPLPPATAGRYVTVASIDRPWFKVHEGTVWGFEDPTPPERIEGLQVVAPVNTEKGFRLVDEDLDSYWVNDGQIESAWFKLNLGGHKTVTELKLAPKPNKRYRVDVFVHDQQDALGEAVLKEVELHTSGKEFVEIALPEDTAGKWVTVQANRRWFKTYEVEAWGY